MVVNNLKKLKRRLDEAFLVLNDGNKQWPVSQKHPGLSVNRDFGLLLTDKFILKDKQFSLK